MDKPEVDAAAAIDGSRAHINPKIYYDVTVTFEGVSRTKRCYFYGDPESWAKTPPGPGGVSRFIVKDPSADENRYHLSKRAFEALRECMSSTYKAFF